jgi:predicted transcriptional regulator
MKIIKKNDEDRLQAITFRLPEALLDKLAALAEKNDISRQKLVAAILQKAIDDKSFKLEIKN